MQTNGFSFKTVLVDNKGYIALKYGVQYLPTTVIIDATGVIKLLKVGAFVDYKELQGEIALNLPDLK